MAAEPTLMRRLAWRLEALGFDLAGFVLRRLPLDTVSDLGAAVFGALGPLTPSHGIARRNIRLVFPELSLAEEKTLLDAQWRSVGRYFFEFQVMDRIAADPSRIEFVHGERLDEIVRTHAPTIFISGHFSNFEIMSMAIVRAGVDCNVTYRATNNPYVDARIRVVRARYGVKLFAPKGSDGAREALEGIRQGVSVALMNDQKFNAGLASPLFGHLAHTATGPTKLAMKSKRPLQTMSVTRLKSARFRVTVHDPIPVASTGDRTADVAATVLQINRFIEDRVREHPSEWFWVHRRWPREAYKPD